MRITTVIVTIKEVRPHPFEHGNYSCSITYEAEVDSTKESVDFMTSNLRARAGDQVTEECDLWESALREQRLASMLLDALPSQI